MNCSSCGVSNEADAVFCEECGASFGRECPSCGTSCSPNGASCALRVVLHLESWLGSLEERRYEMAKRVDGHESLAEGLRGRETARDACTSVAD